MGEPSSNGGVHVVDRGTNLLMICSKLLYQDVREGTYEGIRKLRTFLNERPRAGQGDKLTFDQFIALYNEYAIEAFRVLQAPPSYVEAPRREVVVTPVPCWEPYLAGTPFSPRPGTR